METHYFGTLNVTRAFVPIIEANGAGALLNVLSVLSWAHVPTSGAYSSAKAAAWAMTEAVREELAPRGVHVAALHVGYMDTDMADFAPDDQKSDPALVANREGAADNDSGQVMTTRPLPFPRCADRPWSSSAAVGIGLETARRARSEGAKRVAALRRERRGVPAEVLR